MEKIFANYIFDKELVFGIHKDISKFNSGKKTIWKIGKRHKQIFHQKKDI